MEGRFCWTFLRSAPELIASGPKQAPQLIWDKQERLKGIWNIWGQQESVVYTLIKGDFCLQCGESHRAGWDARLVLEMYTYMGTRTWLVSPWWAGEVLTAPVGSCPPTTHRQSDMQTDGQMKITKWNLMLVFNFWFEVKLKKKIMSWIWITGAMFLFLFNQECYFTV